MTQRERSDASASGEIRLFVLDGDGIAYGVPADVVERNRRASIRQTPAEARARAGTIEGSIEVGIPADAPVYELPAEALAPYRLTEEERAAAEAQRPAEGADTGAFGQFIGIFPGWVAVEPKQQGIPAGRSQVHTYSAAFWFNSGSASRQGPYPGLR